MSVTEFGHLLIRTRDLDPVYCMLVEAELETALLRRWLFAYWLFYHSGVASRIASSYNFWKACQQAHDEKWPRGTERRHFRGKSSAKAIASLQERERNPEQLVDWMAGADLEPLERSFRRLDQRIRQLPQFGPWISFKVCDMVERVLDQPVLFTAEDVELYKEPATGAKLAAAELQIEPQLTVVLGHLRKEFWYAAPPLYDRMVNLQEVETVLCKWKSHLGGHYPVGKDTREVAHHLEGWGSLAERLRKALQDSTRLGEV